MKPSQRRFDLLCVVAYLALALLFHPGLVFEAKIVADFDAFVYFYPLREYAARSLAEGRLPLWSPHTFFGAPFFANPQTGVLYPPNLVFNLLPVPWAYSVALVGHVFLAGALFHLFARCTLRVGPAAAALGALAYMFSGFLSAQVGHLNQLQAAAWLPLLVTALDEAQARLRAGLLAALTVAAAGGVALAFQVFAGHPQETYLSLAVLALLALWRAAAAARATGAALAPRAERPTLRRRAALVAASPLLLATLAAVGLGLAAVQLVPTFELSAQGIRGGGLDYADAVAGSLPPNQLHRALLPNYWENPCCERVGYVGVTAAVLAVGGLAALRHRWALPLAGLALLSLALAFGGANPLYPLLLEVVPGLGSFRVPARWLFPYTFALAGLATLGFAALEQQARSGGAPHAAQEAAWGPRDGPVPRAVWLRLAALGGALLVAFVALQLGDRVPNRIVAVQGTVALATLGLAAATLATRFWRAALGALLVLAAAELWLAGSPLPQRAPVPAEVFVSPRDSTLFLQAGDRGDRVLSIASENYEIKETPDYKVWYADLPPEELRNFLVAQKYNEILMPNVPSLYRLDSADGYDGGVLPTRTFVLLSELFIPAERVRPDGVWQSRLDQVPDRRLLDLGNIGQVLAGKIKDVQVDGVVYDRAIAVRLAPGERRALERLPGAPASALRVLAALEESAAPPDGTVVARLTLSDAAGASRTVELRAGEHLRPASVPPSGPGRAVPRWNAADGTDLLSDHPFERLMPARLVIENVSAGATLRISALTLVDGPTGRLEPLVLDDAFERTVFFDMKVYRYRDVLGRAYLVHRAEVLPDDAALERLRDPSFRPGQQVVLAPGPGAEPLGAPGGAARPAEAARIGRDEPERVTVEVEAVERGYLVLSDGWSPDWQATVDGAPAPVLRANVHFRAVPLPAGRHVVEFRYEPRSLQIGAAISAGAAVALLALLGVAWQRRRVGRNGARGVE